MIKSYLAEFHPTMIGLTGTWEQVKAVCKAYRVYFSTPPNVKPGQDYLVDHSIYFYLMGECNFSLAMLEELVRAIFHEKWPFRLAVRSLMSLPLILKGRRVVGLRGARFGEAAQPKSMRGLEGQL